MDAPRARRLERRGHVREEGRRAAEEEVAFRQVRLEGALHERCRLWPPARVCVVEMRPGTASLHLLPKGVRRLVPVYVQDELDLLGRTVEKALHRRRAHPCGAEHRRAAAQLERAKRCGDADDVALLHAVEGGGDEAALDKFRAALQVVLAGRVRHGVVAWRRALLVQVQRQELAWREVDWSGAVDRLEGELHAVRRDAPGPSHPEVLHPLPAATPPRRLGVELCLQLTKVLGESKHGLAPTLANLWRDSVAHDVPDRLHQVLVHDRVVARLDAEAAVFVSDDLQRPRQLGQVVDGGGVGYDCVGQRHALQRRLLELIGRVEEGLCFRAVAEHARVEVVDDLSHLGCDRRCCRLDDRGEGAARHSHRRRRRLDDRGGGTARHGVCQRCRVADRGGGAARHGAVANEPDAAHGGHG
mmetsp:Transcript_2949/g.8434  ORF Transcript_2949/g.8434 Transcript_2949/m.8434 type:complete len:415 (+) Transcript_2949:578-1822(+)